MTTTPSRVSLYTGPTSTLRGPAVPRARFTSDPNDGWRKRAACRDANPELFFSVGQGPDAEAFTEAAKKVCGRCPVRKQCLDWALTTDQDYGVWGGLTEDERRAAQGRRRRR